VSEPVTIRSLSCRMSITDDTEKHIELICTHHVADRLVQGMSPLGSFTPPSLVQQQHRRRYADRMKPASAFSTVLTIAGRHQASYCSQKFNARPSVLCCFPSGTVNSLQSLETFRVFSSILELLNSFCRGK